MDARAYYELAASIDEATTLAALAAVRERVARTDLLAWSACALEHLLRARDHTLRFHARLGRRLRRRAPPAPRDD